MTFLSPITYLLQLGHIRDHGRNYLKVRLPLVQDLLPGDLFKLSMYGTESNERWSAFLQFHATFSCNSHQLTCNAIIHVQSNT